MAKHEHKGSHLEQGPWGAFKTLAGPQGGADIPANITKGPSIAESGGEIPANVPTITQSSSDNLTPKRADVAGPKTADRQGGGLTGHDRSDPNAGKSTSKEHVATRVL